MTDKAAIAGTYHNLRPIVGRRVFQVHIEIPIERMSEFVRAFGEPNCDTWIALARIETNTLKMPGAGPFIPKERRKWDELTPQQQAGIRASDKSFHKFLLESGMVRYEGQDAAEIIREQCSVESRRDIIPGTTAHDMWRRLDAAYQSWLRETEVVG